PEWLGGPGTPGDPPGACEGGSGVCASDVRVGSTGGLPPVTGSAFSAAESGEAIAPAAPIAPAPATPAPAELGPAANAGPNVPAAAGWPALGSADAGRCPDRLTTRGGGQSVRSAGGGGAPDRPARNSVAVGRRLASRDRLRLISGLRLSGTWSMFGLPWTTRYSSAAVSPMPKGPSPRAA